MHEQKARDITARVSAAHAIVNLSQTQTLKSRRSRRSQRRDDDHSSRKPEAEEDKPEDELQSDVDTQPTLEPLRTDPVRVLKLRKTLLEKVVAENIPEVQ
jgi:hypothetical protein